MWVWFVRSVAVIHSGYDTTQQQMAITAIRELKVLQKLKHKNIVALKEVVTEGACMHACFDLARP